MAIHIEQDKSITDRLLQSWVRCRRKAWLDRYGEQKKRLWSAHRTLQLDHQHRSFVALINKPYGRGLKACQEGASFVMGLKLKGKGPEDHLIEANPPLLKKIEGVSKWGEFSYIPVITRQGYKLTREHKLSLSFTGLLLERLQESPINEGIAISKTKSKLEIEKLHLSKSLNNQLLQNLIKLKNDLNLSKAPPLTSNRRKCSICIWKSYCDLDANKQGHLSEVIGVGAKRIEILQNLGINNLKELANFKPSQLKESLGDNNGEIAQQIIAQALAQSTNNKKRLDPERALPELDLAKGALLYDIESDPDERHDFLHGLVKINRKENGEWNINRKSYQPILSLSPSPENEALIWKRIKKKLKNYPNWPIIHYGETESLSLYRLAKRQNASEEELKELHNRFIDIHSRLRKHWCLPINSYGLKTVASLIGFQWHKKNADGPTALLWWRQWRNSRSATKVYSKNLENIFNYNKDDCLATWAIANWMIKQD